MSVLTQTSTGFQIDEKLLASIQINEYGQREPLELGEVIDLQFTDKTEPYNGVEYPIFALGKGRTMNLSQLAHLYLSDDKYTVVGEGEDAIIPFGTKLTRFKEYIATKGEMPKRIRVVKRNNQGATAKYLTGEYSEQRINGYKINNISTEAQNFPLLLIRKGADDNIADSWRMVPRVAVEAVEAEVATAPAPLTAPVA